VQSSSQIATTTKPTLGFLQAGCPSCQPTNSVKALKERKSSTSYGLNETENKRFNTARRPDNQKYKQQFKKSLTNLHKSFLMFGHKQDILGFEIPMRYVSLMQILSSLSHTIA